MPRMALRDVRPWAVEPNTSDGGRIVVGDWLPALFVLIVQLILTVAVSGNWLVAAVVLLVADVYVIVIRWLSRAPADPPEADQLVTDKTRAVRTDLAWLRGTLAPPIPGSRPIGRSRDRPRA